METELKFPLGFHLLSFALAVGPSILGKIHCSSYTFKPCFWLGEDDSWSPGDKKKKITIGVVGLIPGYRKGSFTPTVELLLRLA